MARINHFVNEPGANYIDNSESIISISPEGTKVNQEIHVEKRQKENNEPNKSEVSKASDPTQLSNRQVIVLLTSLLNIALSPEYTNQKQLAIMISRITGRSMESIRQTIMNIAKNGLETEQARKDMLIVAETIEPISKRLADRLRNDASTE